MSVLQKILVVVCCVFLLVGCYEDESEITLNADGSGTVKGKLVISERLIVAVSEDGGNKNTPPVSKEKVLETVGSAVDITSITLTELPDGGRIIEFEGTFSSAEQFFLSEFCRETLNLRLAPVGDGKAAIYCDAWQSSGDASGPSTTQLYGLAKGLYIKRTVHLPAEIEKTNGYRGKDKKTVSWVTDLRNKEGLGRTKAFAEGKDKGVGSVVFDASALTFSLPLKTPAPSEKITKSEKVPLSEDVSTLKAEVSWVSIKKKMSTDSNSQTPALSDLEIGIKVSWDEDYKPYACFTPVLTNLTEDLNHNLVKSKTYSHQYKIHGRGKSKNLSIRGETPANSATKLKNITGYVEIVTEAITKTFVLENINQLVGKESTGNPILDKLNCKIEDIHNNNLNIKIDGGYDTIQSAVLLAENGEKIKSSSRSSSGQNACTLSFRKEISLFNKCELEVVIDQKTVKVPFSLDEVSLP